MGEKQMWLEPQPWALIGGCVPPDKADSLFATINELVRKPSPIGALLQSQPDPTMKDEPGTGTNGGIFAAINGTLIWALSMVNGEMAWDEWLKNTLARHAETYPDMWFGIWSGPDAYHSVLSKYPGGTGPDFPGVEHARACVAALHRRETAGHGVPPRRHPVQARHSSRCVRVQLGAPGIQEGRERVFRMVCAEHARAVGDRIRTSRSGACSA